MAEECLAMCQRLNAGDASETANAFNNCAFCLEHLGRWSEALPKYQAALEMGRRLYKQDDPNVALFGLHVGGCLQVLGRPDEALAKYQDASAMFERLASAQPGNNQVKIGLTKSRYQLGGLLVETGKTGEAAKNYQSGLELTETILKGGANPSATRLRQAFRIKLGLDKAEVMIRQISPDSEAQVIGLREGDVLIRYASKPVDTALDLPFLTARAAGTGIELEIRRDGTPLKLNVKAGPLGVVCEDRIVARKDSP
jgi:tetratricopeptide (TPR) repeat protein